MKHRMIVILIALVAMMAFAPISFAQSDDEVCVTISGNEVCGSPATIANLLELTNSGDEDATEESEFFTAVAPNSGTISINVPTQGVDTFKLARIANNQQTAMLNGAHHIVAEPGGRTTEDCSKADEDISALCSLRTNVQQTFVTDGPSRWLLPEGSDQGPGHIMLTGPTMVVELADGRIIELERGAEDHSYMLIVSGSDGDGETPGDLNNRVNISEYDAGSTMITSIPPSQFVSRDYVHQNVSAAFANECGNDGCNFVTLVTVDSNGAVSVVSFSIGEAELIASNWYVEDEAEDD